MNFIQKIASAAALACGAAGTFAAQPAPFYGEASVGVSSFNADCGDGINCDDSDVGFRALGGFRFGDMFSVEAGYLDFGKLTYSAAGNGLQISASTKTSGPFIAGAYHVDLMPKLDMTARLGAYYGMNKSSCSGSCSTVGLARSQKENKLKPYFGVGAYYEVIRGLSVGGSLDLAEAMSFGDSGSVVLLGASVRYAF